ncbi:hypothetical protein HKX48_001740 [Thoreauomyces humboldtii]|nr:hypothetical protein HKX48_001740 [Thoreauomyces humboldtii]
MAKSGRAVNPADAHRKQQRKRELKKNKEDRKKVRLVATAQKDTKKLFKELQEYQAVDHLEPAQRRKKQQLDEKLQQINKSREELGLAPVDPNAPAPKSKSKQDVEVKWYHPTFNPHGPKKPARTDAAEEEAETSSAQTSNHQAFLPIDDLSHIPLPKGTAANSEAQIYHTLDLPEIRNSHVPAAPAAMSASRSSDPILVLPFQHHMPPPLPFPPPGMPGFGPPFMQGMPPGPPPGPPPFGMQARGFAPGPPPGPPPLHVGGYAGGPIIRPFPPGPPPFMRPPPHLVMHQQPFHHQPYPPPPHIQFAPPPFFGPPRPPASHSASLSAPPPAGPSAAPAPARVIAAAPVVRDLQAESVKLVPAALLRKRAAAPRPKPKAAVGYVGAANARLLPAGKRVLNAAPDVGDGGDVDANPLGQGLLAKTGAPSQQKQKEATKTANEEYDEFMNSMKDLL